MKVFSAIVKLVLRKNKTLANGMHPIMLRVSFGCQREKSTGYCCDVAHWDKKNQMVKPGFDNSEKINKIITEFKTRIINRKLQFEMAGKKYTPDMLLDDSRLDFNAQSNVFKNVMMDLLAEKHIRKGTQAHYLYAFKQLAAFDVYAKVCIQNAAENVLAALTFPEANAFDAQNEAAIILAQAERKDECIVAINKAMDFPESRNFATLVQYAKILELFGEKNEAVKVINRALPLVQDAQPSNVVEAAKLMLKLNREKFARNVQSLLRPLLSRPNVSWTAETLVDFALVCYAADMSQEAREALEKARRMNPVLVENLLKRRPELKELFPGQIGK